MHLDLSHLIVAIIAFAAGAMFWRERQYAEKVTGPIQSRVRRASQVSQPVPNAVPEIAAPPMPRTKRLFGILFTTGWLVAWSAGIVMVWTAAFAADGTVSWFLIGWLVAAVAAWFWAVHSVISLIRGQDPGGFSRS